MYGFCKWLHMIFPNKLTVAQMKYCTQQNLTQYH
jgi:hypothetical protein